MTWCGNCKSIHGPFDRCEFRSIAEAKQMNSEKTLKSFRLRYTGQQFFDIDAESEEQAKELLAARFDAKPQIFTCDDNAYSQAKAQLESIREKVERLKHIQECPGSDDELCDMFGRFDSSEEFDDYHNEDEARESISNDPLEVAVRSGWGKYDDLEPEEYKILLCTGGPAVQILGGLTQHSEPDDADITLQYQDWFTPWIDYPLSSDDREILIEYARQFYYGD